MGIDLRIRQIVFACNDRDTIPLLQKILGLGAPFPDPGVGAFGLINGVFALGDQFVEIVIPVKDTAPARRFLDRSDKGGYMAIFQVPDMTEARTRLEHLGMRRVWDADLEDISASHIHPSDIGGAIVSIDQPRPPESWKWGGPDWTSNSVEGGVTGITLASPAPEQLAAKWAGALGAELSPDKRSFETQDGPVSFTHGPKEEIIAYSLRLSAPKAAIRRAADAGLSTTGNGFIFAGIRIEL